MRFGTFALASLSFTLAAQQQQQPVEFEIASIKPNKSNSGSSRVSDGRGIFRATNITVKSLLLNAYDVLPEQIMGLPSWVDSDRFDIEGKADFDPALTKTEQSTMNQLRLQALLASRFEFKMHREMKEWQSYALVVAKQGSKLTAAANKEGGTSTRVHNGHMEAEGMTMDSLVRSLSGSLGRPIVNETGLEGRFDLTLDFEPEQPARPPNGKEPLAAVDSAKPSILTAVQDQLGLKLESRKSLVRFVIVDRISRPSEN